MSFEYKYYFAFKIFYLIVSVCNLIFNNGCFNSQFSKFPKIHRLAPASWLAGPWCAQDAFQVLGSEPQQHGKMQS